VNEEGIFDFGPVALGIDSASRMVGVCMMTGDGYVVRTWGFKAAGELGERVHAIHHWIRRLFDHIAESPEIQSWVGGKRIVVYIEEGIFGGGKEPMAAMPKNAAMAGEVRGVIFANAWCHGWEVKKMYIQSWKAMLSKEERKMKKDKAYVAYWAGNTGVDFHSPDEVDAYMIARRAVVGR
jgi:hypothetical protein